jgi:signal transduction histidine kinase
VATVVESVLKTLHLLAEERGIVLRQEGLDTLPSILADDRRLYNAFYNLVNNAIAEVPAGGSITIRGDAESERDTILLSVADTGRGMPEEVRKSLFTTRTISRKPGGTGLGTRIVKDVVEAHGGRITGESQEGVGTTFFIRLPLQPQVGAGSPKVMQ